MVYWGTPVYEEPTYSAPAIVTPGLSLGTDLSKSYLSLKKNTDDDTDLYMTWCMPYKKQILQKKT